MSAASVAEIAPARGARASHTAAPQRVIRVGLLGLGHVNQAVARLAAGPAGVAAGLQFRIESALVRDVDRARRCERPPHVTSNASAFLRGRYDVVIEALGGVEPARTIVARLLGRGVPVVSANKTLIASAGPELQALASARGTTLRYEASAMAGVPFLGTLAARPLVASVNRFAAVLNGTSNFILSSLDREGGTLAGAIARAQARGLTEPDPSRDVDGDDAADKLALLTTLFGWGSVTRDALEVRGLRDLTSVDLRAARDLGGALKPIALASRVAGGVEAAIGPAWVPSHSPLAALNDTINGIELHGQFVCDLFFSGPGAGPDITAATLLDDCVEALHARPVRSRQRSLPERTALVTPPVTRWFIRIEFPGVVPTVDVVKDVLGRIGVAIDRVSETIGATRYVLAGPANRTLVDAVIDTLQRRHRLTCVAFRCVE